MRAKVTGVTLIELMIVVLIMSIIAAIGYPSYTEYVLRGKRSEGRAALLDAAAKQERFYSDCNRYGTLGTTQNCTSGIAKISTSTEGGLYTLNVNLVNNNQGFTLTADPTFTDAKCGKLSLTHAGVREKTGTGTQKECWGK